MKTEHLILLGAAAAGLYFVATTRLTPAAAPGARPAPRPQGTGIASGFLIPTLKLGGAFSGKLEDKILERSGEEMLEGYFPTGAVPCCDGCAQGRGCSG